MEELEYIRLRERWILHPFKLAVNTLTLQLLDISATTVPSPIQCFLIFSLFPLGHKHMYHCLSTFHEFKNPTVHFTISKPSINVSKPYNILRLKDFEAFQNLKCWVGVEGIF